MAFQRTRNVNGRTYTYWVEAYRDENGEPRQRHLGKRLLGLLPAPIPEEEKGLAYIESLVEKYPGDPFAEKAAKQEAAKSDLAKELGVDLSPTTGPVEKATSERGPSPETAPDADASAPGDKGD